MRRLLVGAALFFCIFFFTRLAIADRGVIVEMNDGKYVISCNYGFSLAVWMGGHLPLPGNIYVGDFAGVGLRRVYCVHSDVETLFFIEDGMASEQEAIEYLYGDW